MGQAAGAVLQSLGQGTQKMGMYYGTQEEKKKKDLYKKEQDEKRDQQWQSSYDLRADSNRRARERDVRDREIAGRVGSGMQQESASALDPLINQVPTAPSGRQAFTPLGLPAYSEKQKQQMAAGEKSLKSILEREPEEFYYDKLARDRFDDGGGGDIRFPEAPAESVGGLTSAVPGYTAQQVIAIIAEANPSNTPEQNIDLARRNGRLK